MTDTTQNTTTTGESTVVTPPPAPAPAAPPEGSKPAADTSLSADAAKPLLDGIDAGKAATPASDWPADWRQKALLAAGVPADDKKALALLERLSTPGDMAKKMLEQEKLISAGKHKVGYPGEGTPEQQAAWRKDNDIPEAPEKYNINLPDGLIVGEADMPIVNGIVKALHGTNASQAQVTAALAEYYRQEKAFLSQRAEEANSFKISEDDKLQREWGAEYRANYTAQETLLKTFLPQEFQNIVAGGFDENGKPLKYNADFLKGLVTIARTINPIDLTLGSGGGNQMSAVDDEISQIEAKMGDRESTYWKGALVDGKNTKEQARLLQLYEWRDRNQKLA